MSLPSLGTPHPLVGASDQGSGWLYELMTKAGVDHNTAKTVTDLVVRPVAVILVLLVAVVVARVGSKALRRILQRLTNQAAARSGSARTGARMSTMSALAANLWRFFVFIIAVAVILGIVGIDLTPLLASATIIGATLGFGAQLIVRDYFSGFLLTLEDQYGIGDNITVGTVSGVVEDLTLRVTRLRAVDGTVYFIANGDIRLLANTSRGWAHAVVDLTLPGSSAAELPQARAAIEEAARRVARSEAFAAHCTEPPSLVTFVGSTENTLTLRVTLHSVPSQRDALTRALREEAVVALNRAELWPAPSD
jgi:moderate conductance mechanosensitive channel